MSGRVVNVPQCIYNAPQNAAAAFASLEKKLGAEDTAAIPIEGRNGFVLKREKNFLAGTTEITVSRAGWPVFVATKETSYRSCTSTSNYSFAIYVSNEETGGRLVQVAISATMTDAVTSGPLSNLDHAGELERYAVLFGLKVEPCREAK